MAKGHRGKQQTAAIGPNTKNNKANAADKENSIDTHNTQSGKGRNRHREKQKIIVSFQLYFLGRQISSFVFKLVL